MCGGGGGGGESGEKNGIKKNEFLSIDFVNVGVFFFKSVHVERNMWQYSCCTNCYKLHTVHGIIGWWGGGGWW